MTGRDLPEFLTAAGMIPDAPIRTPSDAYRVVALIAEVLQSMERDTTSLHAAAGAAWHLMAQLASDRSTGDGPTPLSTAPRNTCAPTSTTT